MKNRSDGIYNVNVKRLALLTLPTWLRRPLCGALVYAGVSPLGRVLADLRRFRGETAYRVRHNGQVCRLRGALNDEFDPELRRIEIAEDESEAADAGGARVWQRVAGRWQMVPRRGDGCRVITREGYGGTSGYDFWVAVPEKLRGTVAEVRLRGVVNMYKLASKRYALTYK